MAYESKFKRDDIDELFRAILLLEDEEDCYRFFEDVCTVNEIHAIAQRLQVAKLLLGRQDLQRDRSCHQGIDGYHQQDQQVSGVRCGRLQAYPAETGG